MRISSIKNVVNASQLAFKSIREDKKQIEELKNGSLPIGENKKLNILASLNNMAAQSDRKDVEFLLDIADNLVYGQGGNSAFKNAITSDEASPENRENTDWQALLQDTVSRAISNTSGDDKTGLTDEFNRIFNTQKELTPVQKEILDLRKSFTDKAFSLVDAADSDKMALLTNIRKNLDYFVSSSEISYAQRKECLEKFNYFLSDDYEIDEQLKDKKLEVVDEMLNDMIIKNPDDDVLTIKDVDQAETGMCAAISICRKALAYEDKVQYMNVLMEELSNKPYMDVFDITELGSGKKVQIEKTPVDYDTAIERGYRIIDASAHHWMQNAQVAGQGHIVTANYTAFDNDTYNIFDDTTWYEGISQDDQPLKDFLKTLIVEKKFISSVDKTKRRIRENSQSATYTKKHVAEQQGKLNAEFHGVLKEIFGPCITHRDDAARTDLIKATIDFYKGKDGNELHVASQMPKSLKQSLIVDFIKSQRESCGIEEDEEKKLQEFAPKILNIVKEYVSLDKTLQKVQSGSSKGSASNGYYKKLYNLAAAHRLAVENDIALGDSCSRYERKLHIPPKDIAAVQYLKSNLKNMDFEAIREKYRDDNGNIPTAEEVHSEYIADIIFLEGQMPSILDEIVTTMSGQSLPEVISSFYTNVIAALKAGDKTSEQFFSRLLDMPNKYQLIKFMETTQAKLEDNPTEEELQDSIRILGYEDKIHFITGFQNMYLAQLQNGISEEAYAKLKERYNTEDVVGAVQQQVEDYNSLLDKYYEIDEKWSIPSPQQRILKKMEESNFILTRSDLNYLKATFDGIHKQIVDNKKIENYDAQKRANKEAYKYSEKDMAIFDLIENSLADVKKYNKANYKEVNKRLEGALKEQYSMIGMLNGQFWVGEEGHSGLTSVEQARIFEQMTGKPYHLEYNVQDAAEEIKKSGKGAVLMSSVEDDDFGFHAQYIPQITSEIFKDFKTGKETKKDVLWTDNSWGRVEKDSFWNGHNGHEYTDYANGYGWKDGFVLDKSFRIGLPVDDIYGAVGHSNKYDEDFGLLSAITMPGTKNSSYQKLNKMFNNIFQISEYQNDYVDKLEVSLLSGDKVNPESLMSLDDLAYSYSAKLQKRIDKEIKSKADFDKLAPEDDLKFIFEKIALQLSVDDINFQDDVLEITTPEDLEDAKDDLYDSRLLAVGEFFGKSENTIYNIYTGTSEDFLSIFDDIKKKFGVEVSKEQIGRIAQTIYKDVEDENTLNGSLTQTQNYLLNRTVEVAVEEFENADVARYFIENEQRVIEKYIDENIRVKDLESPAFSDSIVGKDIIAAIDKYLKPKSDEELIEMIQAFQEAPNEKVQDFIDILTPADVGIKIREPYEMLQLYKAEDPLVSKAFSDMSGLRKIDENMKTSDDDLNPTSDELYRTLYVKLTDMDVQKFIRKFQAEAFQKYQVRQAFPEPVVISDEDLSKLVLQNLGMFNEKVARIQDAQKVMDILDSIDQLFSKYSKSLIMQYFNAQKDFPGSFYQKELTEFSSDIDNLAQMLENDTTLEKMKAPVLSIKSILNSESEKIDAKNIGRNLKQMRQIYDGWKSSSMDYDRFYTAKKDYVADLKENEKLFVEANIEKRYQNDAFRQLEKIINMYRKNADDYAIKQEEDKFIDLFCDRHITKNPTEVLSTWTKLSQNGHKDEPLCHVLRDYLVKCLQVAQQTKVQYKLVQNQHEGITTKLKDMLPLFDISLNGENYSLDSAMGMFYLIKKLENVKDGNVILNLFLDQSGLAEKAIDSYISVIRENPYTTFINNKYDEVNSELDEIIKMNSLIDSFTKHRLIKGLNFKQVIAQFKKYVLRHTDNLENSKYLSEFVKRLDDIKVKDESLINQVVLPTIVDTVLSGIIDEFSAQINEKLNSLEKVSSLVQNDLDLLYSIAVPNSSDAYNQREEYTKEATATVDLLNEKIRSLSEKITNNNLL